MNIPILYVFNFNHGLIGKALNRLNCSLQSVINQIDEIFVLNASELPIELRVQDKEKIKIIHKPYNGYFNKSILINYAVKNYLRKYQYFIFSDIDLVYPASFVDKLKSQVTGNNPVRVIPRNQIIDYEYYTCKYDELYLKSSKIKQHPSSESHGNGLIHTDSFMRIRGYNEYYLGYSPEDQSFNNRISKINKFIFMKDLIHIHLWHDKINREFSKENKILFENERMELLRGRLVFNPEKWGEYGQNKSLYME